MPKAPKEFFNLTDHQLNGESDFQTHWGNFGYWQSASTYPKACEALATLVADSIGLDAESHLLDCGFGAGEQLLTWINRYQVASIMGVNLSMSQTAVAEEKVNQLKPNYRNTKTKVALYRGDAVEFIASHNLVNLRNKISHIIALDCAYHFQNRETFFKKAQEALQGDGKLALTDFTFRTPQTLAERVRLYIASILIRCAKIPKENVISAEQYQKMLGRAGFVDIDITDITDPVINGFCQWLPRYKTGGASPANSNWMKYNVTAVCLRWASRHKIIHYQLISASR